MINHGQRVFLDLVNGQFRLLIDFHSARIDKLKAREKRGLSYWDVRGHHGSERLGISVTTGLAGAQQPWARLYTTVRQDARSNSAGVSLEMPFRLTCEWFSRSAGEQEASAGGDVTAIGPRHTPPLGGRAHKRFCMPPAGYFSAIVAIVGPRWKPGVLSQNSSSVLELSAHMYAGAA